MPYSFKLVIINEEMNTGGEIFRSFDNIKRNDSFWNKITRFNDWKIKLIAFLQSDIYIQMISFKSSFRCVHFYAACSVTLFICKNMERGGSGLGQR